MSRVPWIALGGTAALPLGWGVARLLEAGLLGFPPCFFKSITGWACLGCGLTRWALALSRGDLGQAFHWHPVATLGLLALPGLAAWDLVRVWRGRPYPPLPDSALARWGVLTLLAGTWVLQVARGI